MNSFEWNKIAGGVLAAALVVMVIRILTEDVLFKHEAPTTDAYPIALAEPAAQEAASAPAEEKEPGLAALLAQATADQGAQIFSRCKACHTVEEGGRNGVGPNLFGVVGAKVAHAADFAYSTAMAGKGGAWTYEALDAFLTSPRDYVPGTKMSFAGLAKASERARVIQFLRANSPDAPPLPAVEESAATAEPVTEAAAQTPPAPQQESEPSLATLLEQASAEQGAQVFNRCKACHSIEEGGRNGVGPNLHGVVGAKVGAKPGFAYSPAMAGNGGAWTYDALDAFLASPRDYAPGTKMVFAGLAKAEERARLIQFLRANSPDAPPLPTASSETPE
ncbi:MAG: c-type cytochrome [Pseudomonadota bacterium]